MHDLGRGLGLDLLWTSGLDVEADNKVLVGVGYSWVCLVLTSWPSCLLGEAWEPGTGEKGLSGLVRLTELRGLAGLLVLKEPDAPLATVKEKNKKEDESGEEGAIIHMTEKLVFSLYSVQK